MMVLKENFAKFLNVQIVVTIKDSVIEENVTVYMDFMEKIALKN